MRRTYRRHLPPGLLIRIPWQFPILSRLNPWFRNHPHPTNRNPRFRRVHPATAEFLPALQEHPEPVRCLVPVRIRSAPQEPVPVQTRPPVLAQGLVPVQGPVLVQGPVQGLVQELAPGSLPPVQTVPQQFLPPDSLPPK